MVVALEIFFKALFFIIYAVVGIEINLLRFDRARKTEKLILNLETFKPTDTDDFSHSQQLLGHKRVQWLTTIQETELASKTEPLK